MNCAVELIWFLRELKRKRLLMKEYLKFSVEREDWHAVQDAASDLRDLDSAAAAFNYAILKIKYRGKNK